MPHTRLKRSPPRIYSHIVSKLPSPKLHVAIHRFETDCDSLVLTCAWPVSPSAYLPSFAGVVKGDQCRQSRRGSIQPSPEVKGADPVSARRAPGLVAVREVDYVLVEVIDMYCESLGTLLGQSHNDLFFSPRRALVRCISVGKGGRRKL